MASEITISLDPERFQAAIWEPRPEYELALQAFRDADVEFMRLERSTMLDLRQWRRVVTFMRGSEIDILHGHKLGSNYWGALPGPLGSVPVFVAHEHTWSFEGDPCGASSIVS